jgi:molecular chaperone DnaK (HSP70)
MPAVGRLLTAMTGIVPQRTVNPDEAVALGCAVQVGVLDGVSDLTVLSPMQAAILRAFAEQKQKEQGKKKRETMSVPRDEDEDDEDLLTYDYV